MAIESSVLGMNEGRRRKDARFHSIVRKPIDRKRRKRTKLGRRRALENDCRMSMPSGGYSRNLLHSVLAILMWIWHWFQKKLSLFPISDNPIKKELTSLYGCCCRGTRRRRRRCILLLIELFYSSPLSNLFRRLAFDRSDGEKRD